jgi:hypothetical protein
MPSQHPGVYRRSVARRELTPHPSMSKIRLKLDEDEREQEPVLPFRRRIDEGAAYVRLTHEGA